MSDLDRLPRAGRRLSPSDQDPALGRLSRHHPIDRGGRGMPVVFRLLLAAAVVALGVGVLYVGAGGLSRVAGAVGSSFGGFADELVATPVPTATDIPISDAPPSHPLPSRTPARRRSISLVTVPATPVGDDAHRIRVLQLKDQSPVAIGEGRSAPRSEWPAASPNWAIQRLRRPSPSSGSLEASASVRYVLDNSKPKTKIVSPKDNAQVNRKAVEIKGTTRARATPWSPATTPATPRYPASPRRTAISTLSLPLASGTNHITITATDPAGNVGNTEFRVRRGSGKLKVASGRTSLRARRCRLPDPIRLTATVTDPDGKGLEGARVTFTLSVPGIATVVTRSATTGDNGKAYFETTIPKSANTGQGLAAVLVKTDEFGSVDDRAVIAIVK